MLGVLREKYEAKMVRMGRGEEAVYEELFNFAAPKFTASTFPEPATPANPNVEAGKAQAQVFLDDVRRYKFIPTLKQYLLLYTSISLDKLAKFMEMDVAVVKDLVLGLRDVTSIICHPGTDAADNLEGKERSVADIELKFEKDPKTGAEVIHVKEQRAQKRYQEILSRHISRFEEICKDLTRQQPPQVSAQ